MHMKAMRTFRHNFITKMLSVLIAGLLWCGFAAPQTIQTAEMDVLVVIVHSESGRSDIDSRALQALIRGEDSRWEDRVRVKVGLMKTQTPTGRRTANEVYDMSALELNKYWLGIVFQGKANTPNFFDSQAALIEWVAQTKGAIAVATLGEVEKAGSLVKVLTVEGRSPRDSEYNI